MVLDIHKTNHNPHFIPDLSYSLAYYRHYPVLRLTNFLSSCDFHHIRPPRLLQSQSI